MSYIVNTDSDRQAMLEKIGASSVDELFASIPQSLQLDRPLDIPPALTELELQQHAGDVCSRNLSASAAPCFLGGGAYDHFIPSVVDAVASRSEYYTAYTPYQAEASQGSLQVFFEYQTLICQLTGMDVSNASLYEGGSAIAEAVLMALSVKRKKSKVLVAESVHPEYRSVLKTYAANLNLVIVEIPTPDGFLNPDDLRPHVGGDLLAVIAQHPNFFGCLEEVQEIEKICHEHDGLFIVSFDPISLGVLKRPGEYGADIAVAEGQCLGNPLVYGGPYLGILTCRSEYVRKMPGRLVGTTTDRNGKPCYVLTLQTREQHIRREKATSNICTNQGLFALRAAVYLASLGPQGMKETAELCLNKAHYAADALCKIEGVEQRFQRPFFKEFSLRVNGDAKQLLSSLLNDRIHAGLHLGRWYSDLGDCISVAVTEKRTRAEIDALVQAVRDHIA